MAQDIRPDAERERSKKIFFPRAAAGLSEALRAGDDRAPVPAITHKAPVEKSIPAMRSLRTIVIAARVNPNCVDVAGAFYPSIAGKDIRAESDQVFLAGVAQVLVDAVDFLERFQQ